MLKLLRNRFFASSHSAALVRGSLGVLLVRIVGLAILFVLQKELVARMGNRSYGIYVYVSAWAQILCLVSLFGIDQVLVRYLAFYHMQKKWNLLYGLIRWGRRFLLLSGFSVAVCTIVVVWFLQGRMEKAMFLAFLVGSVLLWIKGFQEYYRAALQGCKRPVWASLPRFLLVPLLLLLCIVILSHIFVRGRQFSAGEILGLECLATLSLLFVSRICLRRIQRNWPPLRQAETRSSHWIRTAFPLLVSSGFFLINMQMGKVLLGILRNTDEVGMFNIVFQVSLLLVFGLNSANLIAAPLIAELRAKRNREILQRVLRWMMLTVLAFSLPVGLVLVIYGREILRFFDPEFVAGYPAMLILLGGYGIKLLAGPVGMILSMTGRQTLFAILVITESVVAFSLGCMLIPSLGLVGASLAMAISNVSLHFITAGIIYKTMKLNPTIFALWFFRRGKTNVKDA